MCRSDVWSTDGTAHHVLSNKVAVNLNVLRPHMERSITGNEGRGQVVTMHLHRLSRGESQLGKKRAQPQHLCCGIRHGSILGFSAGPRYNGLLLRAPCDKITSNVGGISTM